MMGWLRGAKGRRWVPGGMSEGLYPTWLLYSFIASCQPRCELSCPPCGKGMKRLKLGQIDPSTFEGALPGRQ